MKRVHGAQTAAPPRISASAPPIAAPAAANGRGRMLAARYIAISPGWIYPCPPIIGILINIVSTHVSAANMAAATPQRRFFELFIFPSFPFAANLLYKIAEFCFYKTGEVFG